MATAFSTETPSGAIRMRWGRILVFLAVPVACCTASLMNTVRGGSGGLPTFLSIGTLWTAIALGIIQFLRAGTSIRLDAAAPVTGSRRPWRAFAFAMIVISTGMIFPLWLAGAKPWEFLNSALLLASVIWILAWGIGFQGRALVDPDPRGEGLAGPEGMPAPRDPGGPQ